MRDETAMIYTSWNQTLKFPFKVPDGVLMTNTACPAATSPHPDTVQKFAKLGIDAPQIISSLEKDTLWVDPKIADRVEPETSGMRAALSNAEGGSRIQLAVLNSTQLEPATERDLAQILHDATCSDTTLVMTPKWGTSVSDIYPRFTLERNHEKLHSNLNVDAVENFLSAIDDTATPTTAVSNGLLGIIILSIAITALFAQRSR